MSNRLACATSCYGGKNNLEQILKQISFLGFKGVEIMSIPNWFEHVVPEEMHKKDIDDLKKNLASLNLKPLAISGHCELGKKEGLRQLIERIKFTSAMGVKIISTGSGMIKNNDQEKNFFYAISQAAELAQDLKILIALETGGNYLPTGKKTSKIIKKIKSNNVGVNYDPANTKAWGKVNPAEDIKYVLTDLIHFHIKDYQADSKIFPPLGVGNINFSQLFDLISNAGYSGYFGIEVDYGNDISTTNLNMKKSLDFLYNKTNFINLFT